MATPMTAQQFLQLLQAWKLPYRERPGWSLHTRTDPAAGRFWGPVYGAGLHHTGDDAPDSADEKVLSAGRPDLEGPLCHWGMADDGTLVLIGWQRVNHFGRGDGDVLDAVRAENYGQYPPRPNYDSVDGNRHFYGQETMYSGRKRMTPAAYLSTVGVMAAVCTFHGWSAKSVIGHKEWTDRKIDPGSLDMADFRADVQRAIDAGPPKVVVGQKTDDSNGTGDEMDREVLEYGGKTYERRGFFLRYIDSPAALHALIDPAPKGLGLRKRDASVADFIGLVDVDKLETKLEDARSDAGAALSGLTDLSGQVTQLAAVVHAPTENVPDATRT